jgi:outer membrane protein OmpA-like peptidoglycan-associated protein
MDMRRVELVSIVLLASAGCGGSQSTGTTPVAEASPPAEASRQDEERADSAPEGEFQLRDSETAGQARGERPSEIKPTATEAAMRLFVVDPDAGPIAGVVIKLEAPGGLPYFTDETDSHGYAEVLVPVGQRYELEYLSLGRRNTTANVEVPPGPNQNIRLTLRYRRQGGRASETAGESERFVLDGILFESGKTTIRAESYPRLDRVVEYMAHTPSARIRVAGHTDNVGNPKKNLALSEARARSVRDYLVSHGVDGSRIEAVGYGDQSPVASNDTEEGRQQNRRIEAVEL